MGLAKAKELLVAEAAAARTKAQQYRESAEMNAKPLPEATEEDFANAVAVTRVSQRAAEKYDKQRAADAIGHARIASKFEARAEEFSQAAEDVAKADAAHAARWQPMDQCPSNVDVLVYDESWCGGAPRTSVDRLKRYETVGVTPRRVSFKFSGVTKAIAWMPLPQPPRTDRET